MDSNSPAAPVASADATAAITDWEPVLEALRKEEAKPASAVARWLARHAHGVALLTGGAFLAAGLLGGSTVRFGFSQSEFLLFVAVIVIHELGHWVAAKWAGYKDLKMFFIPFVGAAVQGNTDSVASWKQVVVLLAGPIPGVLLGFIAGIIYAATGAPIFLHVSAMLAALNLINLLPLPILDGGKVLHGALLCRRWWLEAGYFAVGSVALFVIPFLVGGGSTYVAGIVFGVIFLLQTINPVAFGRISERLRTGTFGVVPLKPSELAPDQLARIVDGVPRSIRAPENLVTWISSVHARLRKHPPTVSASVLLLVVYASGLALSYGTLLLCRSR